MEVQDLKSQETIEFIETIEKLTKLVKAALNERTPTLNGERLLTNKDMEKLLHISERLLNDYRKNGVIPYIQISGKILYKESDVMKLLEKNYYG